MDKKEIIIDDVKMGDHLCLIYNDDDVRFSILVPYFQKGLKNNEKCYYVVNEIAHGQLIDEFSRRGLNLNPYIKSGQFVIGTKEEIYLPDGEFDIERTISTIKSVEKKAIKEGYYGVRATGEMSWALDLESGRGQLMEYEARLNELFDYLKFVTICQYDETKFNSGFLVESIHTHPIIVLGDKVRENKYYFNPFLSEGAHQVLPAEAYSMIVRDLIDGD